MHDRALEKESEFTAEESVGAGLDSAVEAARTVRRTFRRRWAMWLHWTIIVLFSVGLAYPMWMVFVEFSPGRIGPLLGEATLVDPAIMQSRRLYAFEAWVIFIGFSLYLALTVIVPRLNGRKRAFPGKDD